MTVGAVVPDIAPWPPLDDQLRPSGRRLLDWAADDSGPGLLLVRGAGGSGKSRLLAWFLAGAVAHPRTVVHATVPAEGLTAETFAWELGRQLGHGPLSPARLLERLRRDERPLLILVPDLHRAGAGPADLPAAQPAALVEELLGPLLSLGHVRAVVETGGTTEPPAADDAETVDLGGSDAEPRDRRPPAYADLVAGVPRTPDGRPDWAGAPVPVRRQVLDAALLLDDDRAAVRELLSDPGFLVHGSATALTAVLADERIAVPGRLRRVWRRAAPELTAYRADSAERAALLHAAAVGTDPALAEYLRPLAHHHTWTATWSHPDLPVSALALTPGDEGRVTVADVTGRLRVLDVETGRAAPGAAGGQGTLPPVPPGSTVSSPPDSAEPPTPRHSTPHHPAAPTPRPTALALRDPRSALLLDESGALLPVVPVDDAYANVAFLLGHIAAHHGSAGLGDEGARVSAVAAGPGSADAVVGDRSGALHVWSLDEYRDAPRSRRVHERPVTAVACLRLGDDGPALVFSAATDGSVRLWETSAEPMPVPVEQRGLLPTALAAAVTPAGPVLAVAWSDGALHLWHVLSGRMRALPLLHPCRALALTPEGELLAGGPEGLYAVRLRLDRLWE